MPQEKVKNIPPQLLRRYFQIGQKDWKGYYRIKKEVRDIVKFMRFNLIENLHSNSAFDIIFCRNVMIYFDNDVRKKLLDDMYRLLKPGGYLMVGHAESLTGMMSEFKSLKPSIYIKS